MFPSAITFLSQLESSWDSTPPPNTLRFLAVVSAAEPTPQKWKSSSSRLFASHFLYLEIILMYFEGIIHLFQESGLLLLLLVPVVFQPPLLLDIMMLNNLTCVSSQMEVIAKIVWLSLLCSFTTCPLSKSWACQYNPLTSSFWHVPKFAVSLPAVLLPMPKRILERG